MGLKNVLIVVEDLEKSKEFYTKMLGMSVVSDAGSAVILTEGLVLQEREAWEHAWQQEARNLLPKSVLYFEEYDTNVIINRLNDSNIQVHLTTDMSCAANHGKIWTFEDPDGNVIELAEKKMNASVNTSKSHQEHAPHDFEELIEIVSDLRGPEGCEWDKAQTHETLKQCLADESEEVFQAIDNKDDDNLCEELGDVLLQVVMNARLAQERDAFTMEDVIQGLCDKLIRRHPHVFGDVAKPKNPEEALELWRMVKQKEREAKNEK